MSLLAYFFLGFLFNSILIISRFHSLQTQHSKYPLQIVKQQLMTLYLHMIYTCNLQMPVCLRSIALLTLTLLLALALAQDSHQTPTNPSLAQQTPPQPSTDHQVAQGNPSSHQTPHNSGNSQNTAYTISNNENIVTESPQSKVVGSQASHSDAHIVHEQHHGVQQQKNSQYSQQATEHHQTSQHHDQSEISHEHIHKMISQMSQQQLAAFQEGLQGEARQYYRQIMQEEAQHEHEEELQYAEQYAQIEDELSKTDIEAEKQTKQFQKQQQKFNNELISFNDYLFELDDDQTETFRITLPVGQRIVFHGYTYQNDEGVYKIPQDVEEHEPIFFRIYQNDTRMVYQKKFYFKYYGFFMGDQNSTYVLRFYNPSYHKLIALSISTIFQKGHVADKITTNDVADHSRRIILLKKHIQQRYDDVTIRLGLQGSNQQVLIKRLDHYYIFSFIELAILLGVCVFQVEFVRKILSTNNII